MPGSLTTPGCRALALACSTILPSAISTASAPRIFLSRLNGWPVPSPADASPLASRPAMHGSGPMRLSGRGADYSTPPPQIPACSFPAPGSRRRSNAIVGLDATDPQARCFSVMLSPALSPEHVLQLTFLSTGRLPSAISATDFSRLCSMLQRYYAAVRLLVCSSTASSPRLPVAARDRQATAGQTRSPRFRRDPSIRDVASDPGRATVPRITAPHMLPSAVATASAPAISRLSWLNPTPHTITVYASPWSSPSTTQHSLPGGRCPFPGPGLSPTGPRQLRLAHRYSFTVRDSHPLLLASLPAHRDSNS